MPFYFLSIYQSTLPAVKNKILYKAKPNPPNKVKEKVFMQKRSFDIKKVPTTSRPKPITKCAGKLTFKNKKPIIKEKIADKDPITGTTSEASLFFNEENRDHKATSCIIEAIIKIIIISIPIKETFENFGK